MELKVLEKNYSIIKLDENHPLPKWVESQQLFSFTKTEDETSIVCEDSAVPHDVIAERNWKIIKVNQKLDFGLTGVLSSIAKPLAENKISIFALSTYDTDYILVKNEDLERAKTTLKIAKFRFA